MNTIHTIVKTPQAIRKQILKFGCAITPIPKWEQVKIFQKSWEELTHIPHEDKVKIQYISGRGYETEEKERSDKKDNFHFSLDSLTRFQEIIPTLSNHGQKIFNNFLREATITHLSTYWPFLEDVIYQVMEPLVNIPKDRFFKDFFDSAQNLTMRSLFYPPRQAISIQIAKSHTDKGFMTLAPYSSAKGLQILDIKTRKWIDIIVPEGHVLLMPGLQAQCVTNGKIKALYHRVLNTRFIQSTGRFAQVAFFDLQAQLKYNKRKHKNTQKKTIGFNYDCSYEEFLRHYA